MQGRSERYHPQLRRYTASYPARSALYVLLRGLLCELLRSPPILISFSS